ncbi:hypothetical protein DdX_18272 [Ditylenchus destructor]|uniref:Uncharacterized protein n=1 Tax=Ditylenchus destructor TaxID=166010 RepID=A0AAD4QYF4_9BILA|nr:hypothetical protein DdX_18272 [Ditylenchus destructor]
MKLLIQVSLVFALLTSFGGYASVSDKHFLCIQPRIDLVHQFCSHPETYPSTNCEHLLEHAKCAWKEVGDLCGVGGARYYIKTLKTKVSPDMVKAAAQNDTICRELVEYVCGHEPCYRKVTSTAQPTEQLEIKKCSINREFLTAINLCQYLGKKKDCPGYLDMVHCVHELLSEKCDINSTKAAVQTRFHWDFPDKNDPECKRLTEFIERGGPSDEEYPKNGAGHIEILALNQLVAFAVAVVFASIHKYFH